MITDEMLSIAASEVVLAINATLPKPEDCQHSFSPRFHRKMKSVFRKAKHPAAYTLMRSAASILLLFCLTLGLLCALSPEVRATVTGWIRQQFGNLTHYSYNGEIISQNGDLEYYLSYVPECYIEMDRITMNGMTEVHYKKEDTNQLMHFYYTKNLQDIEHFLDSRNHICLDAGIPGQSALFYLGDKNSSANGLFWTDPDTGIFFWISAPEETNVLLDIYYGIKILSE